MNKLDITIYDLFGEKNDSGYVLVDIKKTAEYINLAKTLEAEHEALKLKHAKVTELIELLNQKSDYLVHIMNGAKGLQDNYMKLLNQINTLEKEIEEMK